MMKSIPVWKQELSDGVHAARLASLYCCSPAETASEAARYTAVLDGLEKTFGSHAEAGLYSAPGRTEIGGNHTDHQHGRVLAGSVNIDMIAAAAPNDKNQLRVQSEGYDLCVIDLNDLEARKEEENTTAALLRGECAAFTQRGAKLAGLDIYISSNVPKGSGVSSSAAFEVLIGVILNDCFMTEKVSPIAIAQIGQWAENVYFLRSDGPDGFQRGQHHHHRLRQPRKARGRACGCGLLQGWSGPLHPRLRRRPRRSDRRVRRHPG